MSTINYRESWNAFVYNSKDGPVLPKNSKTFTWLKQNGAQDSRYRVSLKQLPKYVFKIENEMVAE